MDGGGHWWKVVDLGGLEVVDFFMGLTLFFATLGFTGLHWASLGYTGNFWGVEVGEFFQRYNIFLLLMILNA